MDNKMLKELLGLVKAQGEMIQAAQMENINNRGLIALLLGEIALLHPDPKRKLDDLLAGLHGSAEGLAKLAAEDGKSQETAVVTHVTEQIVAMAEAMLVRQPKQKP